MLIALVPLAVGFVIRRGLSDVRTSYFDIDKNFLVTLKTDFLIGSLVFHFFFHMIVEGYLVLLLDRIFGTQFVNDYVDAVSTVCLLFVPDERVPDTPNQGGNGLVINQTEHSPLPRVLFVAPYTVQEIQAMKLWDHLVNSYAIPFMTALIRAVVITHAGCLAHNLSKSGVWSVRSSIIFKVFAKVLFIYIYC